MQQQAAASKAAAPSPDAVRTQRAPSGKTVNWCESVQVVLFEPLQVSEIISPELLLESIVLELCDLTGDSRALELARYIHEAKRDAGQSKLFLSLIADFVARIYTEFLACIVALHTAHM